MTIPPSIVQHYIFANTPAYLMRQLRLDSNVQVWAIEKSPAELAQTIRDVDGNAARTAEDVARAYASCAALMLASTDESIEELRSLTTSHLQWIPRILRSWEERRTPITRIAIRQEPSLRLDGVPGEQPIKALHTITLKGNVV